MLSRSTKESWLQGPGDLKEAVVEDVPVPGESVQIKALPASFSAKMLTSMKLGGDGPQQGDVDMEEVQILQFQTGVIEPKFTIEEVRQIADKYGPAYHKVMAAINELSSIDEEAIKSAEARFPAGGDGPNGHGRGELGADVPVAAGPGGRPDLGV